MAKSNEPYRNVVVESFRRRPGAIEVRVVAGQPFREGLMVECSRDLVRKYPLGTRFRIRGKLTDLLGGGEFVYSHYSWPFEVLSEKDLPRVLSR
jgi:hypothetical protein